LAWICTHIYAACRKPTVVSGMLTAGPSVSVRFFSRRHAFVPWILVHVPRAVGLPPGRANGAAAIACPRRHRHGLEGAVPWPDARM
jgi:hypothetical protein